MAMLGGAAQGTRQVHETNPSFNPLGYSMIPLPTPLPRWIPRDPEQHLCAGVDLVRKEFGDNPPFQPKGTRTHLRSIRDSSLREHFASYLLDMLVHGCVLPPTHDYVMKMDMMRALHSEERSAPQMVHVDVPFALRPHAFTVIATVWGDSWLTIAGMGGEPPRSVHVPRMTLCALGPLCAHAGHALRGVTAPRLFAFVVRRSWAGGTDPKPYPGTWPPIEHVRLRLSGVDVMDSC